jgi:hypothetical protein
MSSAFRVLFLAAVTLAPAGAIAQSRGLAPITDAQAARIDAALELKTSDKALTQAVSEAAATIAPFLKIHSCMTGYNASSLNVYAAPGKTYPNNNYIKGPMPKMYKHDKAACVSVVRIQGWKLASPNAMRFEVVYASDLSGESGKGEHEVQKQPSGEWLFSR